jgi:sodium/potassium-transporting ATPase subunit alpha
MVPAISFAYENPELDIMERVPRNSKRDHLVNLKLISFSYLQMGVVQAAAGMYTYMLVLNDYGIRPSAIWFLCKGLNYIPHEDDVYDPAAPGSGHSCWDKNVEDNETCDRSTYGIEALGWDLTKHSRIDVRLYYHRTRDDEAWTTCRWAPDDEDVPKSYRISNVSDKPICYTTEALKYAQASYLVSIVAVQASGLISAKTRNLSLYQQGMINGMGNFGLFFEFALVAFLLYVKPLNMALSTRGIAAAHFAVPSFSFTICIFFYDEIRKVFLRRGMVKEQGRLRLRGWIVQNTYY